MRKQPVDEQVGLFRTSRRAAALLLLGVGLGRPQHGLGALASHQKLPMKLQLQLGGQTLTVLLDTHATALDFAALLPLQLQLEDYAATEKIATLPRRLSIAGAPAGYKPAAGDVAYYAPWGNLALFHKPFAYSAGLIRLGRIEQGVAQLAKPGRVAAELRLSAD